MRSWFLRGESGRCRWGYFYETHISTGNEKRNHIGRLEALGYTGALTPAA